jgi:hypothetical protein
MFPANAEANCECCGVACRLWNNALWVDFMLGCGAPVLACVPIKPYKYCEITFEAV